MPFNNLIRLIQQGEPVAPGTPNRPLRDLDTNVRYILELLQAAEIGSTLFARNVAFASDCLIGQPVYWNADTARFELALEAITVDVASGQVLPAPSAHVWGLVYNKDSATTGDILLAGFAALSLANAVPGTIAANLYYLSATTAGGLTSGRNGLGIPICRSDGQGRVFVLPHWQDNTFQHQHYKFDLVCVPAGINNIPVPGQVHTITAADELIAGWLPADDPSFLDRAPAGAFFGYNLEAHPQLRDVWPPIPSDQATIEWDPGADATRLFQGVPDDFFQIDVNGLWWMTNCTGDVPWPIEYTTASESVSLADCPRAAAMAMRLWFSRPTYLTESAVVTSLIAGDDRIEIVCATDPTKPGSTGPLQINLSLTFLEGETDLAGSLVYKSFNNETGRFDLGPVVEGIYSGSNNLTISGTSSRLLDLEDPESATVYQGLVQLTVDSSGGTEVPISLVRLEGVTEETFQNVMYLGMPAGQVSSYRGVLQVPTTITTPTLQIVLWILGRSAGTLPDLTITGRRITAPPNYTGTVTNLLLSDSAVVFDPTIATLASANQYVAIISAEISVTAGDMYFFTVTRNDADGYAGEVGILRQLGLLSN